MAKQVALLSRHHPQPTTGFSDAVNIDGSADIFTIRWSDVVANESQNIASWLLYFHSNQHTEVRKLLDALQDVLFEGSCGLPWEAETVVQMTTVLVEVLMDEEMFSSDLFAFSEDLIPRMDGLLEHIWHHRYVLQTDEEDLDCRLPKALLPSTLGRVVYEITTWLLLLHSTYR